MEGTKLNKMKILITGGAGFIGTHLCRKLISEEHYVRVIDNFDSQIHGNKTSLPTDLEEEVDLIIGDIRDKKVFFNALEGIDTVVHFAAATGTGQSMYDITHYESVNLRGTTHLIDYIVNHQKESTINKIVVASSRAVYGEGSYKCIKHGVMNPGERKMENLKSGKFDLYCPVCNSKMKFIPTKEGEKLRPNSFYGLTKQFQEQLILMYCKNLGISGYALRFQNVYGPGQSLNNPYTGILAIFSNLARQQKDILIFEDGHESRDFVFIEDVINATISCLKSNNNSVDIFNVGSGEKTSVINVAKEVISYFNSNSKLKITGSFRKGDIRHNIADLSKINSCLGYNPAWKFNKGVLEFLTWANSQENTNINFDKSINELSKAKQFFFK